MLTRKYYQQHQFHQTNTRQKSMIEYRASNGQKTLRKPRQNARFRYNNLTESDATLVLSSINTPSFQRFSSCANSAFFCCFSFTAISLPCQLPWRCSSRSWILCVAVPTLLGDATLVLLGDATLVVFCGDAVVVYWSTAVARLAIASLKSLPFVTGLHFPANEFIFAGVPRVTFFALLFSLSIFFCQLAIVADTGVEVALSSVVSRHAARRADTGVAVGSSGVTRMALTDGLQMVVRPGTMVSFTSPTSSVRPIITLISLLFVGDTVTSLFSFLGDASHFFVGETSRFSFLGDASHFFVGDTSLLFMGDASLFSGDFVTARLRRGGFVGPELLFGVSAAPGRTQTFFGGSFGLKQSNGNILFITRLQNILVCIVPTINRQTSDSVRSLYY